MSRARTPQAPRSRPGPGSDDRRPPRPGDQPPGAALPLPAVVALVALAVAGVAALAAATAALAAGDNVVLIDAGAIARHGAPAAAVLADLSGALTLGGSIVAAWIVREESARSRALLVSAICAGVWTLAQALALAFSYAVATGQPVGSPRFGSDASVFLGTDLGVWLITGVVVAALTTSVALLGSSVALARAVVLLAGLGLFAKAMTGHAAGDANHEVATSTMLVHLLAMGIWVGALGVLQLLPPGPDRDSAAVIRRFSHLALIAWCALLISGVWALSVRMNGPSDVLTSLYVQIGVAKAVLLGILALFGLRQRRLLAGRVEADAGARISASAGPGAGAAGSGAAVPEPIREYRRLAVLELGLMGIAVGLAAAMSSSPPPAQQSAAATGPAGILTGYPLPPAPGLVELLTTWRPDAYALAAAIVLLLLWWRPTGPARSSRSSLALLAACAVMVLITSSSVAVYAKVLVSAHLMEHLLLMLLVGPVLGALVTLPAALRRAAGTDQDAPAEDGRRSTAVLAALGAVPVLLLVAVYATPLLRLALDGHAAHLALLHLAVLAGAAPVAASRLARGRALVLVTPLLVVLAAGIVLMTGSDLIQSSWFGATGRTWRADALADQRQGGIAVTAMAAGALAAVLLVLRRR
ncbi:copper-binding protein [Brachybacterium phenoliresistens]|uniref:Copper-binding protein n=1 Tax=Brachybacterium phenoliresistens TaxID=396014 RepID=Z9JRB7_9MICO|nr:cytochrome c oxidase assembly protein [Brachybacterium phenoliresistens]EWS80297.1 copper-binding protein [Brachybacterium phenoliresistens]